MVLNLPNVLRDTSQWLANGSQLSETDKYSLPCSQAMRPLQFFREVRRSTARAQS